MAERRNCSIPKDGIAISFHGDSEATVHQAGRDRVLMSQERKAFIARERKEMLEKSSLSDLKPEESIEKHASLILKVFGIVLAIGLPLMFFFRRGFPK